MNEIESELHGQKHLSVFRQQKHAHWSKCVVAGQKLKIFRKGKHEEKKKKAQAANLKCNMETAVCTHDSYDYDFAKDSNTLRIYADWLHVAFYVHFHSRVSHSNRTQL